MFGVIRRTKKMVKKRNRMNPLGNAAGSQEAIANAAQNNAKSLGEQLKKELQSAGASVEDFLKEHLGIVELGKDLEWRLASGKTATFKEVTLTYDQVENETVVTFDINGRDQSMLTKESLEDLDSLQYQQFYPAVGRINGDKIDILDGSRRRAWFLFNKDKSKLFKLLVTHDDISLNDAKALAKQLQTAKEHNLREIGLRCQSLKKSNVELTQSDISKLVGISQAAVSKSLKAASIDESLIKLFPIANDLSYPDYALLEKVMKIFDTAKSIERFTSIVWEKVVNIPPEYSSHEAKEIIISEIKTQLKTEESRVKKGEIEVKQIVTFSTKGVYARKKSKGRNFSYEFSRLPKSVQDELDESISKIVTAYQQQES